MKIPRMLQEISDRFLHARYQIFLVGGIVRDMLLNRPLTDYDMATDALPTQVMQLFPRTIPTGLAHGTVTVIWKRTKVEITTLRSESEYHDHRHPQNITFGTSIEEDLGRRDFTMNAVAIDLKTHKIIDPYHGQQHIQEKIIKPVGEAAKRFEEDALRMLRAVRFTAQLGFTIEEHTLNAIRHSQDTIPYLAKERIHDELMKLLTADFPAKGMQLLLQSGLNKKIFDFSISPPENWQQVINDIPRKYPMLRLTILVSNPQIADTRIEEILRWMTKFRFAVKFQKHLQVFCKALQTLPPPNGKDHDFRLFLSRLGKNYLDPLCHLLRSLPPSLLPKNWEIRMRAQAQMPLTLSELAINGKILMEEYKIPRGEIVGKLLHHLLDEVLHDPPSNSLEELQKKVSKWLETHPF